MCFFVMQPIHADRFLLSNTLLRGQLAPTAQGGTYAGFGEDTRDFFIEPAPNEESTKQVARDSICPLRILRGDKHKSPGANIHAVLCQHPHKTKKNTTQRKA